MTHGELGGKLVSSVSEIICSLIRFWNREDGMTPGRAEACQTRRGLRLVSWHDQDGTDQLTRPSRCPNWTREAQKSIDVQPNV